MSSATAIPDLERDAVRDAEQAFDRLNSDYGVPAG
jgi:hypothetical protein